VTPSQDTTNEGSETVIATLAADAAYTVGTPSAATVTILDDDRSTVTIVAVRSIAFSLRARCGEYSISNADGPNHLRRLRERKNGRIPLDTIRICNSLDTDDMENVCLYFFPKVYLGNNFHSFGPLKILYRRYITENNMKIQ